MTRVVSLLLIFSLAALPVFGDVPVSLKGSADSIARQYRIARQSGYTFADTPVDLPQLTQEGELIHVPGNRDYAVLRGVSSKLARPELRLFIERLGAQYRKATGEKLVVTSLTRPVSTQPKNAHTLSVHPAGMAVDLRISRNAKSRQWLENTLLSLERQGVLDVTRERYPPHYHVALFPKPYTGHVERLIGPKALAAALRWESPTKENEDGENSVEYLSMLIDQGTLKAIEMPWGKLLAVLPLFVISFGLIQLQRRRRLIRGGDEYPDYTYRGSQRRTGLPHVPEWLIENIHRELLPELRIESVSPNNPVLVHHVSTPWQLLGAGNFAAVFVHPGYPDVVIKIYAPGRPGFEEEVDVYRRLGEHPAYSSCLYVGNNFLVLKRLRGITLYDSVHRGLPIPERVIRDIDHALDYARLRGLHPHDVHGRNVMMHEGRGLVVDISDFLKAEDCSKWDDLKKAYYRFYRPILMPLHLRVPYSILDFVRNTYRTYRKIIPERSASY